MFIGIFFMLVVFALPFGIGYAVTRPKGTNMSVRARKGCGFVAAFPLLFMGLFILAALGSAFIHGIADKR